jgi:hypothetical protein
VGYRLGIIAQSSLMELQTGILACPLMLAVMLVHFPLYSTSHKHHHATQPSDVRRSRKGSRGTTARSPIRSCGWSRDGCRRLPSSGTAVE